jgi:predicted dehydrogenase/threonine dehydrogenase-like Zn-dependent dehydrogenase
MLQVLQDLKKGIIDIANVPLPQVLPGQLLITSECSLISKGTEKMMLDFGKANYLNKARQQPDKVKMVLNKIKTDGLKPTIEAVTSKLNQPTPLGYSNVGKVVEVGAGVTGFSVGDRVVSNGHHAEVVSVPQNLCAKIPDAVNDTSAAFTVVAAIGLQGVRLINPTIGERFVVTGLGLIGLITCQILKANGCQVLGLDFDQSKVDLAKNLGIEAMNPKDSDPVAASQGFSRGAGVDGVIITASTSSSEPIQQAAEMCRKKGRIVLVGVTGMELNRTIFFKKELSFQVSCSYGPGRYDPEYEDKGLDYPLPYVRWTEQRNFETVLDLVAAGRLNMEVLVSHRFNIEDGKKAYDLISNNDTPVLGVLIDYPNSEEALKVTEIQRELTKKVTGSTKVSFIGAGNYASRFLMPAFKAAGTEFESVITGKGVSAHVTGQKFDFKKLASELSDVYKDDSQLVVIGTRHDVHGEQVLAALQAGKHVFVEKPLALTLAEVDAIEQEIRKQTPASQLMVGFNRRFSSLVIQAKQRLEKVNSPKVIQIRVNAGQIPTVHWTQDLAIGGRRLVGEGCHFIDLARHLAGAPIQSFQVASTKPESSDYNREDQWSLNLSFADGSVANILYFSNGNKAVPKEFIQVHCDGMSFEIDNFRSLTSYGWKGLKTQKLWSQDKGQSTCIQKFVESLKTGEALIPVDEILEVARYSVKAAESLRQ